jgi:His-Xaa-Ser system radical SAM maturase HxsC
MLKLSTKEIKAIGGTTSGVAIKRLTTNRHMPIAARCDHILITREKIDESSDGFFAVFTFEEANTSSALGLTNIFVIPDYLDYLADGDVVRFSPDKGAMRALYRKSARSNSMLTTERCNNLCLMCSQPPKEVDDSYLVAELLEAIPLMDRGSIEVCLSGGEPTLLGDSFFKLIYALKNNLPETAVHILSNGRRFKDSTFAQRVSELRHPDLMIGIPIYSDISNIHDYVVQADGAFDETIRGILQLKAHGVRVEIRVVIHQQTYARLPQLARFIARNLLFVDHVALMGLEMTGFTRANIDALWIDPADYQKELVEAALIFDRNSMKVSIYNHQLCLLDPQLWRFNARSISDWKNEYMPECEPCTKKAECGGFFSSAYFRYSEKITAL